MTKIRKEQISSAGASDGYVLTANGAGVADWEAVPSGLDLSDATPLIEAGVGASGDGTLASRDDHVHPAFAAVTGVGEVLVMDGSSAPPVMLTNEAQDDFLYADLA